MLVFHCAKCYDTRKSGPRGVSPATDGDRDRDPHQSNRLSPQGPVEEQKEGEDEQGSLDRQGLVHPLR